MAFKSIGQDNFYVQDTFQNLWWLKNQLFLKKAKIELKLSKLKIKTSWRKNKDDKLMMNVKNEF